MRKFRYILLGILIAFSLQIKGQTDTEFWFAKPNITQEHVSENFKIVVTAREFDAEVRIEMPSRTDFTPIVLNVPAFSTVTQNILKSDPRHAIMENTTLIDQRSLVDANRTNIGNKAILITSTSPISVYFTNTTNNNSDIYALKGANGIGREFIIPFQSHGYNMSPSYNERGFSSADIIAIEDGTVVEIIPPAGRSVFRNGLNQNETNPYTITLNRGEVYSCAPGWDATTVTGLPIPGWWGVESNQHLGGLIIRVTSGPGVAVVKKDDSVRDDMGGGYDIIGDQWVPYRGAAGEDNDILGTEYVAMKGGLGNNREWVYVAAPEDNTRIWWGGTIDTTTTMPNATINRGQQQGVQFNSGIYPNDFLNIISNKPLSVLHVSGNGTEMGGAVLPPIDRCTGSTSVTFVRDISWPLYINIMVRAGAQGGFLFDGVVRNDIIDSMAFNPVGLSGDWVAAQFLFTGTGVIDVGDVHTITNTRDVFHLGLINGDTFGGCRFGYFSDFNELDVGANTIQGGGNQPSSSIRACEGDTVQLFATGGSQFLWWPSVNLSSTTISNPTAIVDGFRTYFVRVSGACGISDTASVLVERAIQPNASFFVEQGSGCGPLDLEFRDMSTDVDETYWDFNREGVAGVLDRDTVIWGNGIYNDLDSTFIHTFSNTSTEPSDSIQKYKVRLRVKTARCTDTLSTIITVYPHVTAGFTLGNLADTVSCNPVDVEFISSNLSVNEDFYRWNFGDGALSPIADTIHRYNNISDRDTTYKAQLVVRSQWFCRDTAEMDILVHPYLEGGFTINEDKGCSPLTVRISNLSSGADSIFLDFGDGSDTVMTAFTHVDHLYRNLQTNDGVDTNVVVMRIKNDEGCEFINYDTIVVYPEIRASYNIDGNSYIGCNSRDVVFTNTSNYGTHLASEFLWTFGDGTNLSSTSNTINHTYLNDRNGDIAPTFTLRAQSIYGCFDDTSNIINIYKALAAFHVDTVHGCSPLEVNVVNNSVGDNINSWNWSYGNGATSTNQNPPTYTYLNSGSTIENYNLILEVNHSNGLCSTSDTIAMQIYPSINIDAITLSDVSVCDSTQINFTSTISDAALPDVDYVWNFGDGASSSLANPSHLYRNLNSASQVTYNVRLDVETNRGCVDNVDTTIIVGNVVQSAFSINVSEGCSPLNVTITNNSKGGTYNWYWNSANAIGTPDYTSTQATEQITRDFVNNSGSDMTFDLTLVSLNANGCSDTLTRQILVHSSVRAQFVSTSGLANCTPFTVNFDNQTDPSSDANTFIWDFDDGVTGNTTNLSPDISHTFVNSVTNDRVFNVSLHAESPHGCFHDTSLNITAYSRVEAGFSITNNEGCPPFTTNIINTSVGNSANVFEWRVDNALIPGSPTDLGDFTHTYNNTDHFNVRDYQVKLTATNPHGCVSTYIDTVEVFEDVVSGYNMNIAQGCNPLTVNFTNTSLVPTGTRYIWSFGDGASSSATSPSNIFYNPSRTNDLNYNIKLLVESPHNCADSITQSVTVYHKPLSRFSITETSSCPPLVTDLLKQSVGEDMYEWRFGDGTTNTTDAFLDNYSYQNNLVNVVQNYELEFWVSTVHGCSDSTRLTLNVFPRVIADFTIGDSPSDTAGCSPYEVSFDASVSSAPAEYFTWDFDDGGTSNEENPSHRFDNTWPMDRTYAIRLIAASQYECSDTIVKNVVSYAQPQAEFFVGPGSQRFPSNTVGIDNRTNPGPWNFLWQFGDINNSTSTVNEPNTFEYEHWGTKKIILTAESQTSPCRDTVSSSVEILPPLVNADFDRSVVEGCEPLTVEFTARRSPYDEDYSYVWDFGDGVEYTGMRQVYTFDAGMHSVKLTAISNEGAGQDYVYKNIVAFPNPEVNFEILPKKSMLNATSRTARVEFVNLSKCLDTDTCGYTWDFGDGEKAYERDVVHQYSELGKYDVKLKSTTVNGCVDSMTISGELEIIGAGEIRFPNAFTPNDPKIIENQKFRPITSTVLDFQLWIYNRWGELIFTTKDVEEGWDGKINGKLAKPDVYVWKAKGKFTNGKAFEKAGDVTLIY